MLHCTSTQVAAMWQLTDIKSSLVLSCSGITKYLSMVLEATDIHTHLIVAERITHLVKTCSNTSASRPEMILERTQEKKQISRVARGA